MCVDIKQVFIEWQDERGKNYAKNYAKMSENNELKKQACIRANTSPLCKLE